MKQLKKMLSVLLVCTLLASSFAFGLVADAGAMVSGVYLDFSGMATAGRVMVNSSGVIQENALTLRLTNSAQNTERMELLSLSLNRSGVAVSGFTRGDILGRGDTKVLGITGTVSASGVNNHLIATVTYKPEGAADDKIETVNAYIWTTTESATTSVSMRSYLSEMLGAYESSFTLRMENIYSATVSNNNSDSPTMNAISYIDTNVHQTYQSLGMNMKMIAGSERAYSLAKKMTLTMGTYDGREGFLVGGLESGKPGSVAHELDVTVNLDGDYDFPVTGVVTTSETNTMKIDFVGRCKNKVILGWGWESGDMTPTINLTVHSYNKSQLRSALNTQVMYGLNRNAYSQSSWDTYENALKAAYQVYGTVATSQTQIDDAIKALEDAYEALKSNVIIEVNYILLDDNGSQKEILRTAYDFSAQAGDVFYPSAITGDFNRSETFDRVVVAPDSESSNKMTINQYYWTVSLTQIQDTIKNAKETYTTADAFVKEYWDLYQEALAEAEAACLDTSLKQYEIDAAKTNLENAIAALRANRPSLVEDFLYEVFFWYEDLLAAYDDRMTGSSDPGNANSFYKPADDILFGGNVNTTQQEIDDLVEDFWDAIAQIRIKDDNGRLVIGSNRYVDKSELEAEINEILAMDPVDWTEDSWNNLMYELYGGYERGDYGAASWAPWCIYKNIWTLADQNEIDAATEALKQAKEGLVVNIDFDELDQYIAQAEKALEDTEYLTKSTVEALEAALETAKDVRVAALEQNAKQSDINKAAQELKEAVEALVSVRALAELIAECTGIYESGTGTYTEKSLQAFYDAMEEYKPLLADETVTQAQIDAAVEDLRAEKELLIVIPKLVLTDEDAQYISENNAVSGIMAGTSIADAVAMFSYESYATVQIMDADGAVVESGLVATGYKLVLSYDGDVYDEVVLVVMGDITGTGTITKADAEALRQHLAGIEKLGAIYTLAADVNGDGRIDVSDLAKLFSMLG